MARARGEDEPLDGLARHLIARINVAVAWQHASSGDWAAYAADVSRGATPQPVPSRHETPAQP